MGKKLNLKGVYKFEEKVDNKSVTVKQNVYFNKEGLTKHLKGKDWEFIEERVSLSKSTVEEELATELSEEGEAVLVEDGSFLEEYAFAAEIADVEGLKPRTVAEAKRRLD
ncbi:hypothetical protein C0995_008608 [Termitomyces sp. Mi166|nr:hypothetical protein C0995_008608 [Termitomyces sp. Mi166\